MEIDYNYIYAHSRSLLCQSPTQLIAWRATLTVSLCLYIDIRLFCSLVYSLCVKCSCASCTVFSWPILVSLIIIVQLKLISIYHLAVENACVHIYAPKRSTPWTREPWQENDAKRPSSKTQTVPQVNAKKVEGCRQNLNFYYGFSHKKLVEQQMAK